jgi:hypothetical protein
MAGKTLPNPGPTPHRGTVKKTTSQVVPNPKPPSHSGMGMPRKTSSQVVTNPKPNIGQTKAGVRKGK